MSCDQIVLLISATQKESSVSTRSDIIGHYRIVKQKQTSCFVIFNFSNLDFSDMKIFRYFASFFKEYRGIRKSNSFVDTKLVFCDGSLPVHSSVLEARGLFWWTKCKDSDIPKEDKHFYCQIFQSIMD